MGPISIIIQWPPRQESLVECTQKTIRLFSLIGEEHASFAGWSKKARSKNKTLSLPKLDVESQSVVRELLLAGQNRTDVKPRTVIPSLGYSITFWNKEAHNVSASLSIHCGLYQKKLCNSIWLEFKGLQPNVMFDTLSHLRILKGMIEIWRPTLGVVTRDCKANHPNSLPNDPTILQYAYFETPENEQHPVWRPDGNFVEDFSLGKLWINSSLEEDFKH